RPARRLAKARWDHARAGELGGVFGYQLGRTHRATETALGGRNVKLRGKGRAALVAAAALGVACAAGKPPPPKWDDGTNAAPASTATANATASTSAAADPPETPYPATPSAPPPVDPPPGKGLEVPLERYIVIDQFGYRPASTKVAVLADPKQ